ncbi:hypothetical protein GCM10012286_06770 [Streptomyces lasiicapitis]|uniref:Uncharacterized protein n=1 Tax=Streptomyces lasiicapitis TaxID=1923961 RepID=A0ABQ2LJ98_9ACTN|nr:hypothetical protein GCM10012286_06770 [Streptomyces lasiicapitis]
MTTTWDPEEVFRDGNMVNQAFEAMQQRFNSTPCWECKGRQTTALIYLNVVAVNCKACGGATRIGHITQLWAPNTTAPGRAAPLLRAAGPPTRSVNGHTQRRINGDA